MVKDYQSLSEQVSISAQVTLADLDDLAERGVVALVSNRPDGETEDQPPWAEVAARAKALGMAPHWLPFESTQPPPKEHVKDFRELLARGERVHMFCRSGKRAGNLYTAAMDPNGSSYS